MTKQGNFTQRTPQAKKQSDQASRQISKQASGSANAPYDLRATFTTPPQTVLGTNTTEPPPLPIRNKGPELGANNLTLEGVATELAPSDFVSQNYETLVALMQEETKKRSSQSLHARGNKKEIKPEPIGDTPFSLVYGTEAVIPAEIGMPTMRTAEVNIVTKDS
ncbi:hypothetical protein Tco_1247581 [Tanacetum coccineum]